MRVISRFINSIGLAAFLLSSLHARAASPQRIKWEDLSMATGKTVSLIMPEGALIGGTALGVDAEGLTLKVRSTTDPTAYPKGELRISRAKVHVVEVRSKGHKFRIIGTTLGTVAGFAGGLGAAIEIQGGILGNKNPGRAALALTGITAGGAVAGYALGNHADRRSTTYEILP